MNMPTTQNAADEKPKNLLARHPVRWSVAGAALAVMIILVVAYSVISNDGTDNYTGAKKQAATWAVNFVKRDQSISPLPAFFQQVKAVDVRPVTQEEAKSSCETNSQVTKDPNEPGYYTVEIEVSRLFGDKSTTKSSYPVCRLLQREPADLQPYGT